MGVLDHPQYQAAENLARITKTYEGMLQRYGHVKAANYGGTGGASPEDLSVSAQKKMEKAKRKYDEAYGVLHECGQATTKVVVDAMKEDKIGDLDLLRNGLTVLASFIRK